MLPVGALFPMGRITAAGAGDLCASFRLADLSYYKDISLVPIWACVCVCACWCVRCAAFVVWRHFCVCVGVNPRGRLLFYLLTFFSQGAAWSRYRLKPSCWVTAHTTRYGAVGANQVSQEPHSRRALSSKASELREFTLQKVELQVKFHWCSDDDI